MAPTMLFLGSASCCVGCFGGLGCLARFAVPSDTTPAGTFAVMPACLVAAAARAAGAAGACAATAEADAPENDDAAAVASRRTRFRSSRASGHIAAAANGRFCT